MKAMIFSAGLGTRLKPWTDKHPKALAMVNGKSLLQRNVEHLQQSGITDVIINVHHFGGQIIETVKQNNGWGSRITISDETEALLDTGGGLLKASNFFSGNEPFVTINADILTDLDLNKLLAFHLKWKPLISFGVTNRVTSRNFLFNKEDRLCGWINTETGEEKIAIASPGLTRKAYSCVAVFQPEIFSLMPFAGKFSLTDAYLKLAPHHLILGYDHTGDKWVDVGKPDSIAEASALFP